MSLFCCKFSLKRFCVRLSRFLFLFPPPSPLSLFLSLSFSSFSSSLSLFLPLSLSLFLFLLFLFSPFFFLSLSLSFSFSLSFLSLFLSLSSSFLPLRYLVFYEADHGSVVRTVSFRVSLTLEELCIAGPSSRVFLIPIISFEDPGVRR